MSENKITTNHIEEVLLNKKKVKFLKEVVVAVSNLVDVLNTYLPNGEEETKAYQAWATTVMTASYKTFIKVNNIEKLPECVERQLLKEAVDEFLKSVEETKATLDDVCISINI
jgi:predicted DNA-binding ArsR family transcriptional regulator